MPAASQMCRALVVMALVLLALGPVLAGCGLGAEEERPSGAQMHVTRDFGTTLIARASREPIRGGDTVMGFLRSTQRGVETRSGGRFVQSIAGLGGRGPRGPRSWSFFVNGIKPETGAAEYRLHGGDRIQWDYGNGKATRSVPAIVGAFPEPMISGVEGKRFPVRVECEDDGGAACRAANQRLAEAGVRSSSSSFGTAGTRNVLRVIVARWPKARTVRAVGRLADGPEVSGVFARFGGERLQLLGEDGSAVRDAAPGTGLVAALRPGPEEIVWVVTGADEQGVERAARNLDEQALTDAFAVAATPQGPRKLPLRAGR